MNRIINEFDIIAETDNRTWDNNSYFHNFILRNLPEHIDSALDIGCGKGAFTRLLAERSDSVTGIDISSKMILTAKMDLRLFKNVNFICGDIIHYPIEDNSYDAIISIAAMHHIGFSEIITKTINMLRPKGTLIIVDLYRNSKFQDYCLSFISKPAEYFLKFKNTGSIFTDNKINSIWNNHTKDDNYLSIIEVHNLAADYLPGAVIKRHLLWRYSLIWKKPY